MAKLVQHGDGPTALWTMFDAPLMYTDTTDVSLDGFFLEGFVNF